MRCFGRFFLLHKDTERFFVLLFLLSQMREGIGIVLLSATITNIINYLDVSKVTLVPAGDVKKI